MNMMVITAKMDSIKRKIVPSTFHLGLIIKWVGSRL